MTSEKLKNVENVKSTYSRVKTKDDYILIHRDKLGINSEKVEEIYNVKFLGEFTLRTVDGGWANQPVAIFFGEKHPEGSNYLALRHDHYRGWLISDGISAVQNKDGTPIRFEGVLKEDTKEILYSAYRHDYQTYEDLMADGGREYSRTSFHPRVIFTIENGEISVDFPA